MHDKDCATFWCDECGHECRINWKESTDARLVLQCTRCFWNKVYVDVEKANEQPHPHPSLVVFDQLGDRVYERQEKLQEGVVHREGSSDGQVESL